MDSSCAVRSFAIFLVIAIAIMGPQARGFAINRNINISPTTARTLTDHSTDESIRLQAKENLKRPNEIGTDKDGDSSKTMKRLMSINKNITEITAKKSEAKTSMTPSVAQTAMEVRRTTDDTKIPTITSDTVEVFDSVEHVTENKNIYQTTNINKDSFVTENQLDLNQTITLLLNTNTATNTETSTETYLSSELSSAIDQMATESERTNNHSMQKTSGFSYDDRKMTTEISHTSEITSDTMTIDTSTSTAALLTTEISTVSSNNLSPSITKISLSKSSRDETNASSKEFSKYFDSNLTESTTTVANTNIPEPLRKKYTSIIRKRVTSPEDDTSSSQTTGTEGESIKAETSNTYVNARFEKNTTSIPYLDYISLELQRYKNQPSPSNELVMTVTVRTNVTTESMKQALNAIDNTDVMRKATVHINRAGYLDHSEKTITPFDAYFTNIGNKENGTTISGTVEDNEAMETESPEVKKVSSSESQSQLAQDAIQKELMKEEALNNNQNNIKRYNNEKADNDGVKPLDNDAKGPADAADSLSVRPIHERTKTTLYTVSPNYKPMKKIDVQPSKQIVRDPDDNSWRNESISSLGIVFKPKNSSKSFKEVLKNKTQTELNNLQEKDSKENVPDLRVRLEKIAEVRKTKKKKLNKDGEEIYTDYEENISAERSIPKQKQETILSVFNSVELTKPTTLTPLESPKEIEVTHPMSVWKAMEEDAKAKNKSTQALFDSLGVNPLTTDKPKKFFNVAEYYDTTDEYDADYVAMSKLDLKKFTVPRTTGPPMTYPIGPMPTRPVESFPDRKPTVQYFPPRKPQKGNANNLDDDIERKINALTFKLDPTSKIEPRLFLTDLPLRIATDRPAPRTGATPAPRTGVTPAPLTVDTPASQPSFTLYIPADLSENYFTSNSPRTTESPAPDRGSDVIKHYRDFLDAVAKDEEDDRNSDFTPLTEFPRRATFADADGLTQRDYDYDAQFRKEVLNRFVDNFNQNSERFKVDFPILYNNSVVHRPGIAAASSRAFLRRLYGEGTATQTAPCAPARGAVELSPAYELHYYVPEQEERQPAGAAPAPRAPAPAPRAAAPATHATHAHYRYAV